jgi:hypothetical protein
MTNSSTTVTTWQRRQYARNRARAAANRRGGIAVLAALAILIGAALAIVGAPYAGAILGTAGLLVAVGVAIS